MHADKTQPAHTASILAMPTDLAPSVRFLAEECANTIDDTQGATTTLRRQAVTLEPISLPDGRVATIRCARSAKGRDSFTVRFSSQILEDAK